MSTQIMTADQALFNMFAKLTANPETAPVAESLRVLVDEFVPSGTQTQSGHMMAVVWKLRQAHPDHADLILQLAMDTGV